MTKNPKAEMVFSYIRNHENDIIETLREFVVRDSSSRNPETAVAFGLWLKNFMQEDGYNCKMLDSGNENGGVLVAELNSIQTEKPILIGGHYDTVLPNEENLENPFRIEEDRIYGNGIIDMKGGIVLAIWAVRALKSVGFNPSVRFVIDSDEEICHRGAKSAEIVRTESYGCSCALSVETGRYIVSVARRGLCRCVVTLRTTNGNNALNILAESCVKIDSLTDMDNGISSNVSIVRGNCDLSSTTIDFRCSTEKQQKECIDALEKIFNFDESVAVVTKEYTHIMPVFELREDNKKLLERINELNTLYNLPELTGIFQSGSSDVTLYQQAGIPSICSLGAIGEGMHTTHEFCYKSKIFERCSLLAACIMHAGELSCKK